MIKQTHFYFALVALGMFVSTSSVAETFFHWRHENMAIKAPIGGKQGDPDRGQAIVIARDKGNCLACHQLPVQEEEFHGTVGPSLVGIANRLSEGEIRLHVVDEKQFNPKTIMPGYYRDPTSFYQVAEQYRGKTLLSAQEVEDVVAYLMTLH